MYVRSSAVLSTGKYGKVLLEKAQTSVVNEPC